MDDWSIIMQELIEFCLSYEENIESLLNEWTTFKPEAFDLDNEKSMGYTYKLLGLQFGHYSIVIITKRVSLK